LSLESKRHFLTAVTLTSKRTQEVCSTFKTRLGNYLRAGGRRRWRKSGISISFFRFKTGGALCGGSGCCMDTARVGGASPVNPVAMTVIVISPEAIVNHRTKNNMARINDIDCLPLYLSCR